MYDVTFMCVVWSADFYDHLTHSPMTTLLSCNSQTTEAECLVHPASSHGKNDGAIFSSAAAFSSPCRVGCGSSSCSRRQRRFFSILVIDCTIYSLALRLFPADKNMKLVKKLSMTTATATRRSNLALNYEVQNQYQKMRAHCK